MKLDSLIDEYQSCESDLKKAIRSDNSVLIREVDLRMSWLRNAIRDFRPVSRADKMLQVDFFMDIVARSTEQDRSLPPLADLQLVIERQIEEAAPSAATDFEADRRLVEGGRPIPEAAAFIERCNLRISVLGPDHRYSYTSPANGHFHARPPESFSGAHLSEIIGHRRFEERAIDFLERCLSGEDVSYCYHLDTERYGRLLQECRMLTLRGADGEAAGTIIVVHDLTGTPTDPLRSAEENRV